MKKSISILLLLLLLYNSGGYVLVYLNLKEIIKEHSMYELSKAGNYKDLPLLKISKAEMGNSDIFRRIKKKEFKYNNKMYDFAKEIDKGDTVYFYCKEDKNEIMLDELFAGRFTKEERGKESEKSAKIVLRFLMTEAISGSGFKMPLIPQKEIGYCSFNNNRSSFISPVITPPPRFLFTI